MCVFVCVCVCQVYGVLAQVRRKVSKEQNTTVHVQSQGTLDLKMRVFVANSVEAKAVWEYITAHSNQVPAPFVLLAQQIHMAVSYDPKELDPRHAAVADRLRKQVNARTHTHTHTRRHAAVAARLRKQVKTHAVSHRT